MKKSSLSLIFAFLVLTALSCKLADKLAGGDQNLSRANDLWSDVPRMDQLAPSQMELPLSIKVIMRTVLNNLWRFNDKNEDKTPVSGDWIVFTSPKTPADVQGFYTQDRMAKFGSWETGDKSTCLDGKESGIDGTLCIFHKIADGKEILLSVVAMKDDSTKQSNVFFLRLEKKAEPGAANTAKASAPAAPSTTSSGAIPYGIDKRPMPTGLAIDTLLPKRVGSYERVKLEKSEERSATPTELKMDGISIYATYRAGDREIFVEAAVNPSVEDAKETLRVVSGDVLTTAPTADNPNYKSINSDPGFVKSVDKSGAFFAWTRGGYFFSANAKGGVKDLDDFMNAFPY